ncbi:hypothetical protein AMTRI_Chr07g79410 [Amborella trichopoda]
MVKSVLVLLIFVSCLWVCLAEVDDELPRQQVVMKGVVKCMNGSGFRPLTKVKVRIECRSPFGDYGGGVETKGGTYRVRLNGAEGPHYPLRFCWAHVPDRSIPKDCPIPVNTKSNFTMVETTTGRATLEASPLIFRTT